MAPKVTPLWVHFTLQPSQPHLARCHYCSKTISRGKEGTNRLNNGGMINHLQRLHKENFVIYKEKESEGHGKKIDNKDETVRAPSLCSLSRTTRRGSSTSSWCSVVQCSAV